MLQDTKTQARHTNSDDTVWPVLNRAAGADDRAAAVVDERLPVFSASATPDVPASLGALMFGVYLALIGALALATAGPGLSEFVLIIAALFVVAFFAVPRCIFAQEPRSGKRPSIDQFLAKGLRTYTGHCSGRAALVQIFIVPVLLTFAILAIGLEVALIR